MASNRVKIAIDAMGGDYAPQEIVAGAIQATEKLPVDVLLAGNREQLETCLGDYAQSPHIQVVDADGVVDMHEEPLVALRRKPQASINVAMNLVKEKQADAVVSAGHSGAAMAAALLRLGRIKGVDRPAIGALFPTAIPDKFVVIMDVGANVDSKPKYLEQFALMGAIYCQAVLGVEKPQVGLLNIGEEECKGNDCAIRTHELLKNNEAIPFRGNAEGRDVLSGNFDVIVCDGFIGNILLKFAEAVGSVMLQIFKEELPVGVRGKLGSALVRPNLRRIKQRIDHAEHGGALLFGVSGVCVISHGSSKANSIFHAIRQAKEAIDKDVINQITHAYEGYLSQTRDRAPQGETMATSPEN